MLNINPIINQNKSNINFKSQNDYSQIYKEMERIALTQNESNIKKSSKSKKWPFGLFMYIMGLISAFTLTLPKIVNKNQGENSSISQKVETNTLEADKKIKKIQPKEFNNDEKLFLSAIFQALPYIKDGKFKKLKKIDNDIILDDECKLYKKGENYYRGHYSFFDNHSFKMDKLKNGNFNLIYKNGDEIEALAFSKDGKLLSKFEAFKQNSPESPYELPLGPDAFSDKFKSLPENTDDKIVTFNNPLSDKELNIIKNKIVSELPLMKIVDIKQNDKYLIFKYNTFNNLPEGEFTLKAENIVGLNYKDVFGSNSNFQALRIHALDNGGYACIAATGILGTDWSDITYLDKDLNVKDENWYRQEKASMEKIKKELSNAQMAEAIVNIKNGEPAQYK